MWYRQITLSFILLILCSITPAAAQTLTKVQGYAQSGNKTVTTGGITSSTATPVQRTLPSCTVTVYDAGTLVKTAIYQDAAGTPKSNPFTSSGTDGLFFFYVAAGSHVDIQFSGSGFSTFALGDVVAPASTVVVANVKTYGAKGDIRVSELGNMSSASSTLNCSDCAFTSSDIGKKIDVSSSGAQATLAARVVSVMNSTTAVLSITASFTLTNQTLTIRGTTFTDCATTAGSTTITSAAASFLSSRDVNLPVIVSNAGRWNQVGTITAVSGSTQATLSFTATGAVTSKRVVFGTDDTAAITSAKDSGAKVIYFPQGKYMVATFNQTVSVAGNPVKGAVKLSSAGLTLSGDGMDASQIYSVGPLGGSTPSYAAILLIADGASRTIVRSLGFIGTNSYAQQPISGSGISDGIFIGSAGTVEDTTIEACRFDHFWLIGLHCIGDGDINSGIRGLTVDGCSFNYNSADGANPSAGRGLRFINNTMTYNAFGGFETGAGDAFIDNNKAFYSQSAFSVGGFGDPAVGTANIVTNNIAKFCTTGFTLGSNIQQTIMTNNVAMQNFVAGIQIQNGFGTQGKYGIMKNNIIMSNGGSGIPSTAGLVLSAVTFWVVEGNTIANAGFTGYDQQQGILLFVTTDTQIVRNNCYGHPAHDYVSDNGSSFTFQNEIKTASLAFGSATVSYVISTFSQIITGSVAPVLSAEAGLGAGSVSCTRCTNGAGTISVTAGAGSGGGVFAKLTFSEAQLSTPKLVLTAASASAAGVMTRVYNLNITGLFFDLADTGAGLTSGTTYVFHYIVIQ